MRLTRSPDQTTVGSLGRPYSRFAKPPSAKSMVLRHSDAAKNANNPVRLVISVKGNIRNRGPKNVSAK
jgi:hypothetical protein